MTPSTEAGRKLLGDLTMGYEPQSGDEVMPAVREGMAADILAIEAEAAAAERAESERLRAVMADLRTYAGHHVFCEYAPTSPGAPKATCDCGFDQALAALEAATPAPTPEP